MYIHICSVNDLRSCTFRCRIAISERGGHIVAVFREETPSLKIARVAVMEMGNLQLQSMTSLHNFLFKSDAQLSSLLTPHSKSFRFHCEAPGHIHFATTQTFWWLQHFSMRNRVDLHLDVSSFWGKMYYPAGRGAIICLVPNDYIWDYPQDVRAFFQPGEEIMRALVPLLRYP